MDDRYKELPASTETGDTGIMHLFRFWYKARLKKDNLLPQDALLNEWNLDNAMLNALGLGLEQTIVYMFNNNDSFQEFEKWVSGTVAINEVKERIASFNEFILQQQVSLPASAVENIFSSEDLAFWEKNGYVILKNAIPAEDCRTTVKLICDHLELDPEDPSTWYKPHADRQGIMLQLFQHSLLEKNRTSVRIRKAFEQLWGRTDLIAITDRVGFNPPETADWKFPGPRMHWDVSLALPIPFGLQGILYLTDTASDQGAFSLVPEFHHKIENWLQNLPAGTDPRMEDIEGLGILPVSGNEGDLIIWHHALPHGSSANHSRIPRYVQYINFVPMNMEHHEKWI